MKGSNRYLFFLIALVTPLLTKAQTEAYIQGTVREANGKPIPSASISIKNTPLGAISNDSGFYRLRALANTEFIVYYSCVGYQAVEKKVRLQPEEKKTIDVTLTQISQNIAEISIINNKERASNISNIEIKNFSKIPNPSGNFESLIKTMPGVTSSNELSSQYSVRGGNFDENLIYVNDIEMIRPFLIRSGQQEGLSFVNPDMVSSVKFSAGGFEARYGDKMSSVLDVAYRKPTDTQCNISMSMLGGSATLGGSTKNKKFGYIGGLRYKTSQYLLNTLDTKGEYSPVFVDVQSLFTYQLAPKLELSFLGNFAQNKYEFIPQTRSTNFGTYLQTYNLTIYFDGKELDKYSSTLGALTLNFKPKDCLSLKFIASGNSSYERETFDIEGAYYINELDNTAGSSTYNDSLLNIGVGSMFSHARNYLWINSWIASHIGTYVNGLHTLRWSLELKNEYIKDRLNEWTLIDSSGYSSPYSPTAVQLNEYAEAKNNLTFNRLSGYLQDTYEFGPGRNKYYLNGGVRFNYWDYSKQLLISPRFRLSVKPEWKRDFMFYATTGVYYQPPFYREMRDFHGTLNPNIRAQKSIHLVVGADYNLKLWNRPFKFTAEAYYKWLDKLIPYKTDNIRIRYIAQNNAKGYATGIDLKLNGEFVPGVESWASLSLLKTEENQNNDSYQTREGVTIQPGYYPRATDHWLTFSLFFQDYLPNNPTLQMHLTLAYSSPVHVSSFGSERFDETFPMGPYRRIDVGLSKILKDQKQGIVLNKFKPLKELLISVEVFNLFNISNKASYLWIKTVPNQENVPSEFAVPNYLTSRRLNAKVILKF